MDSIIEKLRDYNASILTCSMDVVRSSIYGPAMHLVAELSDLNGQSIEDTVSLYPYLYSCYVMFSNLSISNSNLDKYLNVLNETMQANPVIYDEIQQFSAKISSIVRQSSSNVPNCLDDIPLVDLDVTGTYKYALVHARNRETRMERHYVRGYKSATYHYMCTTTLIPQLEKLNFECSIPGGGWIDRDDLKKSIHIRGFSYQFGRADHEVSAQVVREVFKDYEVTCGE